MIGLSWQIQRDEALTPAVRAFLLATFGYNAPGGDTWAALVDLYLEEPGSEQCIATVPISFVAASTTTAQVFALATAACESRRAALLNAQPLTFLRGKRFRL